MAREREDPPQRVAVGRVAAARGGQRAGRVGRDELEVDPLGALGGARAEARAGREHPVDRARVPGVGEEEVQKAGPRNLDALVPRGVALVVARIRAALDAYRVTFDRWFTERTLHEGSPSAIDRALKRLEEEGHLYRSEGALWLRTTTFGDDKDRVLIRSSGEPTYFAADVAYHEEKLERGYDRLINVLGSDHHGYVARVKAGIAALGADPDRFEVPLLQFVHIVEGESRASMSKRRGDFITLDELIAEIGVDATRWFMLSRSHDSTVDLDLELAKRESSENPVYYVQYAHARIHSVLAKAGSERVAAALGRAARPDELHESERELVRKLLAFSDEVAEAAERRGPHRIAAYALELAQVFTAFYRDCQVVGSSPEAVEDLRLRLCVVSQRTIARALDLLGVHAPDEM